MAAFQSVSLLNEFSNSSLFQPPFEIICKASCASSVFKTFRKANYKTHNTSVLKVNLDNDNI